MDEVIIGASSAANPSADPNGNDGTVASYTGVSYVLFGGRDVDSDGLLNLSDLDGVNGFAINGIDAGDNSGTSVSSAGDINGDGVNDVIIGAFSGDPNGVDSAGESYVVFGVSDTPITPPSVGPDKD